MMDAVRTAEYARALYVAHGERAEVEAAQRMRECAEAGRPNEAEDWKRIRRAVSALRGPRQS